MFTFQVGSFAHAQSAKELMTNLEHRGFTTRMDQGKLNNKTFYKVFAVKEGSRAELEAELLAGGVAEPRLAAERPATAPAPGKAPAANKAAEPAGKPAPAAKPAATAPSPKPAAGITPSIAPPVVEPAPPLPDGYVPPPKKNGS